MIIMMAFTEEEVAKKNAEITHLIGLANRLSYYADGHELKGRWMRELRELKQELAECNTRNNNINSGESK